VRKSSARQRWSGAAAAVADPASQALPFVLSLTAGRTDVIGFLGLFTAHITGNLVVMAATSSLATRQYFLIFPVFTFQRRRVRRSQRA
jgi:uncharacterized membrane protein YoaK (UPF0700 family)